VIGVTDKNSAIHLLLLEMALKAKRRVPGDEHALIDGSVRRMAGNATLADGFMFKNKRASLRSVTLKTGFILS